MWTIFKLFIKFLTILLVVCILVFFFFFFLAASHVGISSSQPGVEPLPSALEGKALINHWPAREVP